jgi:hypothetical protein
MDPRLITAALSFFPLYFTLKTEEECLVCVEVIHQMRDALKVFWDTVK